MTLAPDRDLMPDVVVGAVRHGTGQAATPLQARGLNVVLQSYARVSVAQHDRGPGAGLATPRGRPRGRPAVAYGSGTVICPAPMAPLPDNVPPAIICPRRSGAIMHPSGSRLARPMSH